MCSRLFPTFSSISFSVSGFMWRSLIHLGLSFVQGGKNGYICILLHADHQLNEHHFLKMLSPPPVDGFSSFVKDQVTIHRCVGSFLGLQFYSIDLPACLCTNTSFYHYCPIMQLEVRDGDSPRSSFIVEDSFRYFGFFVIPNEFVNCPF